MSNEETAERCRSTCPIDKFMFEIAELESEIIDATVYTILLCRTRSTGSREWLGISMFEHLASEPIRAEESSRCECDRGPG